MPDEIAPKRNRVILITAAICACLGMLIFCYWFFWAQFHAYTDDAYVDGNMVIINPQVTGTVTTIYTDNSDLVDQGQALLELDRTDFKIALESASAELGQTIRTVIGLFAQVDEYEALIEVRQAEALRARQDYDNRKGVVDAGGVSREDFEHVEATLVAAEASLDYANFQYDAAVAQVQNTTVLTHPLVEKAKENLRAAWVNLQRTTIVSPARGIIAKRKAQVGETIDPLFPTMTVVPLDQIWVTANFKEEQLKNVRIGQPVKVTADFYGDDVVYSGKIVGLEAGTGSVFSVLPPQNATGNWIKIVQRLPVRISLPLEEVEHYPLRLGLSLEVTVDTHQRLGKVLPEVAAEIPLYSSDVYGTQIDGSQDLIEKIIAENICDYGN